MKIKQNSQLPALLMVFLGAIVGGLVFFYAFIGVMFMHSTKPTPMFTSTCDRIRHYEDETFVCEVRMVSEDENIIIMRGE